MAITVNPPDTTAPSVPQNLHSSNRTASSFTLNWTASTDNVGVVEYEVKRDGVSLGTTAGTSMNISGLAAATAYGMQVRARVRTGPCARNPNPRCTVVRA